MEARPEVKPPHVQALHDPFSLSEPGDHGLRMVGESTNVSVAGDRSQDAGDEGLRGGIGEAVGVEDEETGNGGGRDAGGEEVGD